MRRSLWLVPALAVLALASVPVSHAGMAPPTWTSSPTSGPSPNTIHVEGDGCFFEQNDVASGGLAVLGGENGPVLVFYGEAVVRLFDKDDPSDELTQEVYPADQENPGLGEWGGPFPIPPGLDPGTYPLEAECRALTEPGEYGFSILGGGLESFDYEPDRSYRVVKKSEAPGAVEAEVSLTG